MAGVIQKTIWLRDRPCTTLGIALALTFAVGMKEVRALFTDLPHVTLTRSGMMGLGLWIYVLLLASSYLVAVLALVRSSRPETGDTGFRITQFIVVFMTSFLYRLATGLTRFQRRSLGASLGAAGFVLSVIGAWNKGPGTLYWGILVFLRPEVRPLKG